MKGRRIASLQSFRFKNDLITKDYFKFFSFLGKNV